MFVRTHRPAHFAVLLASLTGCSAIVDTTTFQCNTNDDCAKLEGAGPTTTCDVAQHVCVGRSGAVQGEKCARHADCGADRYCVQGTARTCAPLKTDQCKNLYPEDALKDDNVLLLGMMAALSGNDPYGAPHREGAEAAIRDIQTYGLPLPDGPGQRGIALLICDESDPEGAAKHLTETLKLPAVIGASTSGHTLKAVAVSAKNKALLLSASATSPELRSFGKTDSGDLFWRTVSADDQQMSAIRRVFPLVEKAVRATARALQPSFELDAVKVAILWKGDAAGQSLFQAAQAMPLSRAVDAIKYSADPTEADLMKYEAEWEMHVSEVLALQPHIVMPLGTTEFVDKALEKIETRWPAGVQRPWYVMPEGSKTKALSAIAAKLPSVGLEQRVIGTAPGARRGEGWDRFVTAFSGSNRVEPGNLAEFAFDSVYLLAYSTAISKKLFPTGVALRDGLARTSCKGPTPPLRVVTGSVGFINAFNEAAKGTCIDFDGASGPVDFDPDGETRNNYSLWCATGGIGASIVSLQTFYDIKEDRLLDGTAPTMLDLSVPGWCRPRQL